jgi:hypothetical protein
MDAVPVTLRHPDARKQGSMFGAFAVALLVGAVAAVVFGATARWVLLAVLGPLGLLTGYFAFRLATARVILDERGLCEPAPFRPTVVTPWKDVVRVRRAEDIRGSRLTFAGVAIEHKGGWKHQVLALTISTRDARSTDVVDGWIRAIREAKATYAS